MIANYGFRDGSGDWYVTIDTDKCNGCSKCPEVCPAKILEVGRMRWISSVKNPWPL